MDAPEKIYIFENPLIDFSKLGQKQFEDDIEYVRTDVFIEKAIDWLQKCLDNGLWVDQHLGKREKEAVIEHFKEWMKE